MKKILIIEDDSPAAYLLASLCEGGGREVEIVTTMSAAWLKLNRSLFDLVFLDIGLTDSTPAESLEALPLLKRLARVVIVTGYANPEFKAAAQKDAHAFILKDDPEFADEVLAQLKRSG